MTSSNWNGSTRFTPAEVVTPRDVEHGLEPFMAWELVREEWAFLPAEKDVRNLPPARLPSSPPPELFPEAKSPSPPPPSPPQT